MDIHQIDRYDVAILSALQADGRMSWIKLGAAVSLSATAVQRRVRALEEAGVIERFTIALNRNLLGHDVHALVSVSIDRKEAKLANEFRKAISGYSEVQACYKLSGNVDFLLDIVSRDISAFGRFIEEKILSLAAVKDASSAIVLDTIKQPRAMIRQY